MRFIKKMPSGDVHYTFYKAGYIPLILVSLASAAFADVYMGVGILAGYSFHRWCDPDWDVMGASSSEGRMVRELPVIGHFLFGISSTYGSMHRRMHRKFLTHFPFVSTAIRLFFIGLPVYFILKSFDFNFSLMYFQLFVVGFWIGLSIADAIHYALDKMYGE